MTKTIDQKWYSPSDLQIEAVGIDRYRPGQQEALAWIESRSERWLFLNAPTGQGKSLIGRSAGAAMDLPAVYLTSQINLQDQFVRAHPDARKLMGRSNYRPTHALLPEITCEDCTYRKGTCEVCGQCDEDHEHNKADCLECPYALAKREALAAPFAVLNTAYFTAETTYVGDFSRSEQLVVIDEADLLESVLLGQVGIRLTEFRLKQLKIGRPKSGAEVDHTWLTAALEKATQLAKEERSSEDPREDRFWTNLHSRLDWLWQDLEGDPRSWVRTNDDSPIVEFKPVLIRNHAHRLIWNHGQRFLLMSASLPPASVLALELGIPEGEYAALELPSAFPAERRPILHWPRGSMAYRNRDRSLPAIVSTLDHILDFHKGRVLVHGQSFTLCQALRNNSRHKARILLYGNKERDQALARFTSTAGANKVLIGPSLKHGVDLPDDLCEAIVIPVLPRLDWGDRRVRARRLAPAGDAWYDAETVQQLVQMTGRGMRHEADQCVSYILDSEFGPLLRRRREMFPKWWLEALRT